MGVDSKDSPSMAQGPAKDTGVCCLIIGHHASPFITAQPRSTPMSGKKVSCDCGKVIRATSDEDLIRAVQDHAQSVHDMKLSRDQILAMAEPS